jgi:type I restriction enzyme S subunit
MHLFNSQAFRRKLERFTSGTTRQRISRSNLGRLIISLPPLAEQKRIAAILDKADAICRKRQQALQLADEFLRSLFLDMFGDPAINPMKFPIVQIGDIVSSANYGTSEKSLETGKYPVLRMLNITYVGGWNFSDLKFTDLDESQAERYLVRKADILFNRTNSRDLVGKTAVFRSDTPMAYAGYLIRLRANERAHPEYISAFFNTRYMKRVLRDKCKDIIGMANINARELQAFRIPLPPFSTQAAFAAVVEKVISGRSLFERASRDAEMLSRALSNRAFSAELAISHV